MFITFEGPEGSGKSTQVRLLAAYLRQQGYQVLETREPGGTPIGDQVRACLHDVANREMVPQAEMLLYSASRAQLVHQVILPALKAGKIVLCDRYADSTIAYQGYGRGLPLAALHQITAFATGNLVPDLTFLLDLEVETGLARRTTAGQEMNRLDLETVAFHRRVRQGYHALAAAQPERWAIVPAEGQVDAVQARLRQIVDRRLGESAPTLPGK